MKNDGQDMGKAECPMDRETVDVAERCMFCDFFDGTICRFVEDLQRMKQDKRFYRTLLRKVERIRWRTGRRRGRGLRTPPVWESWPRGPGAREEPGPPPGPAYGTPPGFGESGEPMQPEDPLEEDGLAPGEPDPVQEILDDLRETWPEEGLQPPPGVPNPWEPQPDTFDKGPGQRPDLPPGMQPGQEETP